MNGRRGRGGVVMVALALLALGAVALSTYRTVLRPAYARDGIFVVLVVGSDAGAPYRPGDPLRGRADAIHLVAVDVDARRATVVDIPRDSVIGAPRSTRTSRPAVPMRSWRSSSPSPA